MSKKDNDILTEPYEDISIGQIVQWIITHTEDERAMNTISNLVFPNTTKYKSTYGAPRMPMSDIDEGIARG